MKVLVTGLGGFTGQYVGAELVASGHQVVGLRSDLTNQEAVADEVAAQNPEAVIHLAGIAFVGHKSDAANRYYQVNTIGTRNLLAALSRGAPALQAAMLVSSANIYGNKAEGIIDENNLPEPVNDYAVSKYAMECLAKLWFDRLPLFIVRPFNYTGVGQDAAFLIPKIVSHFLNVKESIELGNVTVAREFNDVRSIATIYQKLLEIAPLGQTINVCTGRVYTVGQVLDICSGITGRSMEVQFNPEFARANDPDLLRGDNRLLKHLIGDWRDFPLEETLGWMLSGAEVGQG